MNNPWLTIPLEDYEGHMAMPDVGQAKMLANEFEELLKTYVPTSAALCGTELSNRERLYRHGTKQIEAAKDQVFL
jgi:hypothetical protein